MKISECYKLLKPGMFVKIKLESHIIGNRYPKLVDLPLIGEIGIIDEHGFIYIYNNTHEGYSSYALETIHKNYKYSWKISNADDNEIEILDELPKEEKQEEEKEKTFACLQCDYTKFIECPFVESRKISDLLDAIDYYSSSKFNSFIAINIAIRRLRDILEVDND